MNDALLWVWGFGPKTRPAIAELEQTMGAPAGMITDQRVQVPDYSKDAYERLRRRWMSAPARTLYFGAPSVGETLGGIVVRCREHRVRARQIVLEDHGVRGIIFMGRDAVSLRTLPSYRRYFEQLREVLAPDAEIYLMHCQAFADGGALARRISEYAGCPVVGMDVDQIIGNQSFEGRAFRATPTSVTPIQSISRAVLHFD